MSFIRPKTLLCTQCKALSYLDNMHLTLLFATSLPTNSVILVPCPFSLTFASPYGLPLPLCGVEFCIRR